MEPEWAKEAKCRGMDLDTFLITENETRKERAAKAVCRGCSVRRECLEFAIETESVGIFGGTTESERNIMVALMPNLKPSTRAESSHNDKKSASQSLQSLSSERMGYIPTLRYSLPSG